MLSDPADSFFRSTATRGHTVEAFLLRPGSGPALALTWKWLMTARHGLYYNVVDALDLPGCPVCRLALAAARRWLDSFAYEGVNDYTVRGRLRAARGFCNTHGWQLIEEIHDLLGPAIIYRDILHTLVSLLPAARPEALEPRARCVACAVLAGNEERYLDVFQESLSERDFRHHYAQSAGAVCRPHAKGLLDRLSGRRTAAMAAALVAERWRAVLIRGESRPGEPTRHYRGIAGSQMAQRTAGLADADEPLLHDPTVRPLELLAGRPRMAALRAGLRTRRAHVVDQFAAGIAAGSAVTPPEVDELGACAVCRQVLAAEHVRLQCGLEPPNGEPNALVTVCTAHVWRLAARSRAATLISTARQTMDMLAAGLGRAPAPTRAWEWPGTGRDGDAHLAAQLEPSADCPLCLARAADEVRAFDHVVAAVTDEPTGLCRLHLAEVWRRAIATGRRHAAGAAVESQLVRWTALRDALLEYIRKEDYQYHHEARGTEQFAPWQATAIVAGEKGIRP